MPWRLSRMRQPMAGDLQLAVCVCALELSDVFLFNSGDRRDPLTIALLLLSSLPLALWRRYPFVTLQLTGWATIALAARHATHLGLGPLAATFAVANWGTVGSRRVSAATLLVAVWLVPLLTDDRGSIPTNAALFTAAWILGALVRERRIQTAALQSKTVELAREREEKAGLAAQAERARIARELHDVLTHSVSVMVIQAQAAQATGDDSAGMLTALERIERVGQETLRELRGLLRAVADETEAIPHQPQPRLDRLDELVEEVRAAGIDVLVAREGIARQMPAGVELSAYRIVQEALTNTLRHTPGASARIVLRYLPGELVVEVLDQGAMTSATGPGDGRGIAGMRERAAAVGGTLNAGPSPGGGFCVRARLPAPVPT